MNRHVFSPLNKRSESRAGLFSVKKLINFLHILIIFGIFVRFSIPISKSHELSSLKRNKTKREPWQPANDIKGNLLHPPA